MGVREDLLLTTGREIVINDPVRFTSPVNFSELVASPTSKIQPGLTTPSVLNLVRIIFTNSSGITVTDFLKGAEGQEISILGDSNTTIANNSRIKTNTGTSKLLSANKVYRFTYFNSIWIEDA